MINSRWIIATALCLANQDGENVYVYIGGLEMSTLQNYTAAFISVHPRFNINIFDGIIEYDVALLQLSAHVPMLNNYATSICLPEGVDAPFGLNCYVAEWNANDLSGSLNEEGVEIISNANCNQTQRSIRDYMICSTGRNSSECRSSQGRSLMCQMCRSCEWYLVGITTTRFSSDSCGTVEQPDVYTRITAIEGWISQVMGTSSVRQRSARCF